MPLSDIVNVIISVQSAQLEREGFGVPCILGLNTHFAERARTYTTLAGMVSDGFLVTDVEYLMASRLFSQSPRPPKVIVARRVSKPTLRWAITPTATNSALYQLKVDGNLVGITADASATVTEIIAALKTQIDALGLAVTVSDQTSYMRIVSNVAGAWHTVEAVNTSLLAVKQDQDDAGVVNELNALVAEENGWYVLLNPVGGEDEIALAAEWVESHGKLYIADSQDSAIENTVLAGAGDIAATLKGLAYARTAVAYHRSNGAFFGAGWAGRVLTIDAGAETWAFKTLAGVPAMTMTDTQVKNVLDKKGNVYTTLLGQNKVQNGTTASGAFIDTTRGSDALRADIGENVFLAVTAPDKLSYDDGGVAVVKAQVRASLQRFVDRGFLRASPEPTVTAPLVEDISSVDRGNRLLPDVEFTAQLAGAIQSTTITGVVTA